MCPTFITRHGAPQSIERRSLLATIASGAVAMTVQGQSAPAPQDPDANRQVAVRQGSAPPLLVSFAASESGRWVVDRIDSVVGRGLPPAARLEVLEGIDTLGRQNLAWALRGTTSNARYTTRAEIDAMSVRQEPLNRPLAKRAALIPIRKTAAWWSLAQDERRAIFEEQSRHIAIGMEYLPGVARRLHHSRELGEPFDFLTWFEYAPEHSLDFERLVSRLRSTPEWRYVDREVDIRLTRT